MVLWLLMIAFPMQGIAAAVMAGCGSNPHHRVTADASIEVDHGSTSHMHEGAADHSHADDLQALDDGHISHPVNKAHSKTKCSSCAGCCLVTAIAPTIDVVASLPTTGMSINIFPEKHFAVNFPDGLERPPHTFLL